MPISYNQNKILALGDVNEYENGTAIIRVGLPLGSHYAVKWGGASSNRCSYLRIVMIKEWMILAEPVLKLLLVRLMHPILVDLGLILAIKVLYIRPIPMESSVLQI